MKVFVVQGNWCNDTWLVGVYDTEEKAKTACKEGVPANKGNPGSTTYWVEEWEVL